MIMAGINKNGRTLIYTCADKEYAHWIPLYCLGLLRHNTNIDIEVGIEGKLCNDDFQAIEYLRTRFPDSMIKINENLFVRDGDYALINGIKCRFNTVRFITEPTIKNEYIYIGDIDIICLEKEIFDKHIKYMKRKKMHYSNIVRKTTPPRLTGLHFSVYDYYYPLPPLDDLDMTRNDEELLAEIVVRNGINLNYSATWRPTPGIHFSINRPSVKGNDKNPGWNAEQYKTQWGEFIKSEEYLFIIDKTHENILEMINQLNQFMFPKSYSPSDYIFIDNENSNWHHQTEKHSFKNGVHTIANTSTTKIYGAFPHLKDGNIFSTDFNFPLCFEFDIIDINADKFQIQIYPTSANIFDITPYVSNDSHVTVKVYSYGFEGFVDDTTTPTFIKLFPNRLTDKCRIGLQLTYGTVSFSNFIVYQL